ncbi:putative MFS transporter, AGZA family, xanthine/uracil permease [Amphibacillus marinus]|uniref:Putative MFS transporter, AGZA family, xanthine/uracil permease n=1 Tax=Amphibacillus marinus TaxID=872970 RepID=A0A1H8H0Q3_9BACI|nr:xanthine permease [Amphibacillus marinus]SEN49610.1 putative MFS transporter, AGZA family, xanthine/uracil permease [Amphibacillus marinus]
MSTKTNGTPWFVKGDTNGFFGLFSNVLTNFLAAIGLLGAINMPDHLIYGRIVPGTAVAIGLGGVIFAIQTRRKSLEVGKTEMTALPYGLSVPHYFIVAFGVILPVYAQTQDWVIAWSTGIAWNLIQGLIMTLGAFVGPFIQKYIPRSALLGSLAGIALTFIAMNPMGAIFTTPYIGLLTLVIVLGGWIAHKKLPGNLPAGLLAIIIGMLLAWVTGYMDVTSVQEAASGFSISFPSFAMGNLITGFAYLTPFLAAAIPLAIYDFLESLDNIESAEVEGDKYPTTLTLLVPALLTMFGSVLGSPYPTIIYIGHPGWKKAGARVGYSLATGIGVMLIAFVGLLPLVMSIIPLVALLPILVYIAMTIGTQAFTTAEAKHVPAMILGLMPFIASYVILQIDNALSAAGTSAEEIGFRLLEDNGVFYQGWQALGSSDILVSMMLITIVIFLIDKRFKQAAIYSLITATLAFFGFIHAAEIGFGTGSSSALGYLSMAIGLFAFHFYRHPEEKSQL